jgi:hypothetical protein
VVLVRIFDIHEQTPDIGVNINVVGVDTHNRREERSRKRKHPQTNVINIAEKHEGCPVQYKAGQLVLPNAKKRSMSVLHYNINFSHNFHKDCFKYIMK